MSKVVCEFRAGDFPLDDAPRSGRPVEVDSNQIETLIENNQRSTTQDITDVLKISKSRKLLVKMKKCVLFPGKIPKQILANPLVPFPYIFCAIACVRVCLFQTLVS